MSALLIVVLAILGLIILFLFFCPFILSGRISQQEEEARREAEYLAGLRKLAEREASDESPIAREARKAADVLPGVPS